MVLHTVQRCHLTEHRQLRHLPEALACKPAPEGWRMLLGLCILQGPAWLFVCAVLGLLSNPASRAAMAMLSHTWGGVYSNVSRCPSITRIIMRQFHRGGSRLEGRDLHACLVELCHGRLRRVLAATVLVITSADSLWQRNSL